MKRATYTCALPIITGLFAAQGNAQDGEPSNRELMEAVHSLTQRLDELEARHEEDQRRIQELEKKLGILTEQQQSQAAIEEQRSEEIQEMKTRLSPAPAQPGMFSLTGGGLGSGNLLNPEIGVFVDTGGSISSRGENDSLNRFNLREVEVDFRAAVTPWTDGVAVVAIHEEIETELNGDVDISTDLELEEAYLDMHTLPFDLAAKAGRFRSSFGRNNQLHTHDLPQVTRPLAVTHFFGPEGLSALGVSLDWLVPNPWDKYIKIGAELINADGGEHAPVLGGPNAENPAAVGRISYFDDITDTSYFEVGGSYLYTATSDESDLDGNVFGLDATCSWKDPDPSTYRSLLAQAEFYWADNDIDRGFFYGKERNNSFGFYAFGQYQFDRDWYTGLRFDYSEFPNSGIRGPDDYDVAFVPYLSWYISEFLRLRLEYQHRLFDTAGKTSSEEAVFLQATFNFGAHPGHPYWVNR